MSNIDAATCEAGATAAHTGRPRGGGVPGDDVQGPRQAAPPPSWRSDASWRRGKRKASNRQWCRHRRLSMMGRQQSSGLHSSSAAKWPENGWFWSGVHGMFRAVSEVVHMRKVGVRDEIYPPTTFYVRWVRFCVYIVAWHRPTLALSQ